MKIISIKQPWASLIVSGVKDVENRTWSTKYRGPLLIHASLKPDRISAEIEQRFGVQLPPEMPLGGIVGIADIVDCVRAAPEPVVCVGALRVRACEFAATSVRAVEGGALATGRAGRTCAGCNNAVTP